MAYMSGLTNRMGKISDGNTISDFDKEEIKRGFSINTSVVPIVSVSYTHLDVYKRQPPHRVVCIDHRNTCPDTGTAGV